MREDRTSVKADTLGKDKASQKWGRNIGSENSRRRKRTIGVLQGICCTKKKKDSRNVVGNIKGKTSTATGISIIIIGTGSRFWDVHGVTGSRVWDVHVATGSRLTCSLLISCDGYVISGAWENRKENGCWDFEDWTWLQKGLWVWDG